MLSNGKRAGLGVCTAAAVALTAGIAMAPAADAATSTTGGLLGGTTSGLTGTVTDLLSGLLGGTTSGGSPVTVGSTGGTVSVGVGGTTIDVSAGGGSLGVGATGTSGVGVTVGGATGATVTGAVSNDGSPTTSTTSGTSPTATTVPATGATTTTASGTAAAVSALRITASVDTVYPVKDGYRDAVVLHVSGTTATGAPQPVNGVVVVKRGSTEVARWTITSSTADLTWDGRSSGKVVAGAYTVTGVAVDATGAAVAATDGVSVSSKKLVTASHVVSTSSSASIFGRHTMAAKPRAGLKTGKVLLRISATATGLSGKQYIVFSHGTKKVRVRILNGSHTTKAVTIPKSFTTYRATHTWKNGTVTLSGVKLHYAYTKLR